MIKVSLISPRDLTSRLFAAWLSIQQTNHSLDSPFFRPEFTLAVAEVQRNVEIAVLEDQGAIVGFFPFQRSRWNLGDPVGGKLSDFHGVVCRSSVRFDPMQLLRKCNLLAWNFTHLLACQTSLEPYFWDTQASMSIDISEGFAKYTAVRGTECRRIGETLRKSRKLAREVGPLRFIAHDTDPYALDTLLRWKSDQYRRTKVVDVFSIDWALRLISNLMQENDPEFMPMLSSLYAGDRLVAAHLGLRSGPVLNYWFPAYDREVSQYSPGVVLLLKILEHAGACQLKRIDLGPGPYDYKHSLMTHTSAVARGVVAENPLIRTLSRGWQGTKSWARHSPLRVPARVLADWTRSIRGRWGFGSA